jgi:hypothetical protein
VECGGGGGGGGSPICPSGFYWDGDTCVPIDCPPGSSFGDGGGGGGCPAPEPPPPQQPPSNPAPPSCSLELEYRGAKYTRRSHASLVVDDSSGYTFTIQGKPEYYPIGIHLPLWGKLEVSNEFGNIGDTQWGPILTSAIDPSLCNQISQIETAEDYYSKLPVWYNPAGPNSNSLIHWLLDSGYVDQYFTAPPKSTGWNTPLYGNLF